MNGLDIKINKLILALRMKNRIVTLSKPEFYSYKLEKVMKKYEFKEMTRLEVELRKDLRAKKFKLNEIKKKPAEEFPNNNKIDVLGDLQAEIKYLKAQIKEIKLESVEFLNKKDLILFLVDTLKNGDPNE